MLVRCFKTVLNGKQACMVVVASWVKKARITLCSCSISLSHKINLDQVEVLNTCFFTSYIFITFWSIISCYSYNLILFLMYYQGNCTVISNTITGEGLNAGSPYVLPAPQERGILMETYFTQFIDQTQNILHFQSILAWIHKNTPTNLLHIACSLCTYSFINISMLACICVCKSKPWTIYKFNLHHLQI